MYTETLNNERVHNWTGQLVDSAVYSEPFETRIKRRRRQERADAKIVRQLKSVHPSGGMTAQELEQRVDAGSSEAFRVALDSVVEREFIAYDYSTGVYVYSP